MVRHRNRRGFTLPEVLVTVAIVAILAAVVIPTVTQQIGKGDDSNMMAGLGSVKTAITGFVTDTRKFPGHIKDLFVRPADTDLDATAGGVGGIGIAYGSVAVARWNGPYNDGSYVAANGLLLGPLTLLDSTRIASGILNLYLTATSPASRLHVDSLLDSGDGKSAGNLTWANTDSILIYKLMPAR